MNRLLIVLLAVLVAEPAPAVAQQDSFPVISPEEAEFIAEEFLSTRSNLAEMMQAGEYPPHLPTTFAAMNSMLELIGAMGSRLTQDGIAVWGIPELDATEAAMLRAIVDLFVEVFDKAYSQLGAESLTAKWREKYRLALGLLAKMGPNGVNLITTNK